MPVVAMSGVVCEGAGSAGAGGGGVLLFRRKSISRICDRSR